MTFEHLLLFRDIVQERSVSRGAALNGVSQPAASQHLREIEERMGVTLLDRSTRPFTLTPAGKIYFQMCRDALQRYEEFQVALEGLKAEVEGTVRIASIYSVGSPRCRVSRRSSRAAFRRPPWKSSTCGRTRFTTPCWRTGPTSALSLPPGQPAARGDPLPHRADGRRAAPSHPLARRPTVKLADLEGCDFIAFDEDLPIRQGIDRFLKDHGVAVNLAMHFDNLQMIKEAVALGFGISILPVRPLRAEIERGRLVAIPIDAELLRPIGIIHRRRKKLHRAAQCFLELLDLQPEPAEPVAAR